MSHGGLRPCGRNKPATTGFTAASSAIMTCHSRPVRRGGRTRWLLDRSRTNWRRLLMQLLAQNVFVDDFPALGDDQADEPLGWSHWNQNGLALGLQCARR
jgi:hypothetical protein